ncbi:MAG: helix-turn-helix transcriptional regulator [Sedimentisphaerales bacterium]|jgi:DNA-binding CsgD family transcriptional regulator
MVFTAKQWEYLRKIWHLTPREVEVAKLVCDGMDNEQIGKELRIEYNTVRAHLGNIFRKAGVKGKARIILEFIQVTQRAGI